MPEVSRQMLVLWAAAVLAVALFGARYLQSARAERSAGGAESFAPVTSATAAAGPADSALVVYVSGAVRRPGIVKLRDGDRIADALEAAGGARGSADLGAVNLAARVVDGQQVTVPRRLSAAAGTGAGAAAAAGSGGAGAAGGGGPVSLASATAEQLEQLDGIGPGLAKKILDFRTQHGGFQSVDQLAEVPGIGEKRLESLRAQLQP